MGHYIPNKNREFHLLVDRFVGQRFDFSIFLFFLPAIFTVHQVCFFFLLSCTSYSGRKKEQTKRFICNACGMQEEWGEKRVVTTNRVIIFSMKIFL